MGVALDEPKEEEFIEEKEDLTFQASQDIRSLMEKQGGIKIDFVKTLFGSRLSVKLANSVGGCG